MSTHCVVGNPALKGSDNWKSGHLSSDTDRSFTLSKPSMTFHILVVEDNLVNQKVLSKQLRKVGCAVAVAKHGEEALESICRSDYWIGVSHGEKLSIVLMDLEMPIMDGISCLKRIRVTERRKD
jgi:CheY-like chemotaxis protein